LRCDILTHFVLASAAILLLICRCLFLLFLLSLTGLCSVLLVKVGHICVILVEIGLTFLELGLTWLLLGVDIEFGVFFRFVFLDLLCIICQLHLCISTFIFF